MVASKLYSEAAFSKVAMEDVLSPELQSVIMLNAANRFCILSQMWVYCCTKTTWKLEVVASFVRIKFIWGMLMAKLVDWSLVLSCISRVKGYLHPRTMNNSPEKMD